MVFGITPWLSLAGVCKCDILGSLSNERQCFAQNAGSVTACYVCIITTLTIQFLRAPKHILFLFYLICILTFQLRQSQW